MGVRHVVVRVPDGRVPVPMAVLAHRSRVMKMGVVAIVVAMCVLVFQ